MAFQKNHRKINIGKWVKWFLIILLFMIVLSLLLQGAINAYISQPQITEKIQKELDVSIPGWHSRLSKVKLESTGLFLNPSLKIFDLGLKHSSNCKEIAVSASNLSLVFSWRELLQGLPQISHISLPKVEVDIIADETCKTASNKFIKSSSRSVSSEKKEESKSEDAEKGSSLLANKALFQSLSIGEATLQYQEKKVVIKDLSTSSFYLDKKLDVSADVHLQPSENSMLSNMKLVTVAEYINGVVKFQMQGKLYEGGVSLKGEWGIDRKGRFELQLTHVPLLALSQELNQQKLWTNQLEERSAWVNCQLQLDVLLDEKKEISGKTKNCHLEGELGVIKFSDMSFSKTEEQAIQWGYPIQAVLEKVRVGKFLRGFEVDVLGGVLHDYGLLSGEVKFESSERGELESGFEDVIIAFSSDGQRGRQRISKLQSHVVYEKGLIRGVISESLIENGKISGEINFAIDAELESGIVNFDFAELVFDPSIQKLLVDGKLESTSARGEIEIKKHELHRFSGKFLVQGMQNEEFAMKQVQLDASYKDTELDLDIKVQEGSVAVDSAFYKSMSPIFLLKQGSSEELAWRNLRTKLNVKNRIDIFWKRADVILPSGPLFLTSKGEITTSERQIKATVEVKYPQLKKLSWDVRGPIKQFVVSPNYKSLKRLGK